MLRLFCTAILVAVSCAPLAKADQIVLKNGDRLTGVIVKSDGKSLTLKSEFAGIVNVPLDAITQITAEQLLYLTLKDNQTLVGTVGTTEGKLAVRTGNAGTVNISQDSIQAIRSKEEQAAYQVQLDRLRNPSLRDLWSGTLDTGLSLSRGNADTTTYNFGFKAARTTTRDKISAYMTALYARNSNTGTSFVSANSKRGGARYDINISSKVFAFGLGDLENDEFQKLDLRLTLGGGLGGHARKTERTSFDIFGGGSLNREYLLTGPHRSSGEVLIGEEFIHKLSARTSVNERAVLFPNMTESGEYRMNFDAGAVTQLNAWLGWTVTFSDRYISNPVTGAKPNDVLLSTGLRLTFGR
jgi:putative salt-induced outer membrane protein